MAPLCTADVLFDGLRVYPERTVEQRTPTAHPEAPREVFRSLPVELRELLMKYALRSSRLFAAIETGDWKTVAELASNPLPLPADEKLRQQYQQQLAALTA